MDVPMRKRKYFFFAQVFAKAATDLIGTSVNDA